MTKEKKIFWIGSSLDVLLTFPITIRKEVGYQLHRIQNGLDPEDWKPIKTVGAGVKEIRVRDSHGIYRIIYVAKFSDGIYVLHSFQKKSQKTSPKDIDIAKVRYAAILKDKRNR